MTAPVREEPPERGSSRGPNRAPTAWEQRLRPLMEHPGEWWLFGAFDPSIGSRLRHRRGMRYPDGDFEFRTSSERDDGSRAAEGLKWLYARYIGPGGREEPVDVGGAGNAPGEATPAGSSGPERPASWPHNREDI